MWGEGSVTIWVWLLSDGTKIRAEYARSQALPGNALPCRLCLLFGIGQDAAIGLSNKREGRAFEAARYKAEPCNEAEPCNDALVFGKRAGRVNALSNW